MQLLAQFLLTANLVILAVSLINTFTVRVVKNKELTPISDSVSILIPLRNESQNVPGLLESVLAQRDIESYEVVTL